MICESVNCALLMVFVNNIFVLWLQRILQLKLLIKKRLIFYTIHSGISESLRISNRWIDNEELVCFSISYNQMTDGCYSASSTMLPNVWKIFKIYFKCTVMVWFILMIVLLLSMDHLSYTTPLRQFEIFSSNITYILKPLSQFDRFSSKHELYFNQGKCSFRTSKNWS